MNKKIIKFITLIIFVFLNTVQAQNNAGFSYLMKKAVSNKINKQLLQKFLQKNIIRSNKKESVNSIYNITPVYTDNMLVDQNIVHVEGGPPGQILNADWAYGHFTNPSGNPDAVFGNLQNALFLPYNDSSMTLLAIDSRLCTIYYFDKDNIFAGINHYGTIGNNNDNFNSSNAFVIGKENVLGTETDFNIYICDEINNRVVHVVYKAIPGNIYGFDGTPFDIIDSSLNYPSDIGYFFCNGCGSNNFDPLAVDVQRLWVACYDNSLHCIGLDGTEYQNIIGYQSPNGDNYYFLTDSRIKLSIDNSINTLAFVDTRRNYLVNCLLNIGGLGNVVLDSNGNYLIKASAIASFPDNMIINSVRYHQTSDNVQMCPYLWVTSGFLPPFDDNESVLHSFKGYANGDIQYLGSTMKPNTTAYYFHDLKNTSMRDGYFDLFTIEQWQSQYGIRRYLPGVDIYNDTLKNYCADSINQMIWTCVLTNDCNIKLTAERKKSDGSWESVGFKKIDDQQYNPPNIIPSFYSFAGKTNTNIQLALPLQDYVFGGTVRFHVQLFPEYDWTMSGSHVDRDYTVSVTKYCLPKPGGCPYLYVNDTTNTFLVDNNILHRSEFTEFQNQDIMDRYKINVAPLIDSTNSIQMAIVENENDMSMFDEAKLYYIDHPIGTTVGVTESNDVVYYNNKNVISTDLAYLNSTDITSLIQYSTQTGTKGYINDTIYAHYSTSMNLSSVKKNFNIKSDIRKLKSNKGIINKADKIEKDNKKNGVTNSNKSVSLPNIKKSLPSVKINPKITQKVFQPWRKSGTIDSTIEVDSIAVITLVGNLDTLRPVVRKTWAANLTAYDYSLDSISTAFARRENLAEVILPVFGQSFISNTNVEYLDINWLSDFKTKYISVVPIHYNVYSINEIPLTAATLINPNWQLDIQSILDTIDQNYVDMDQQSFISLKFSLNNLPSPVPTGYVRDYIFEVVGQYAPGSSTNKPMRVVNNQVPLTNKLYYNYPNPFNPTTTIRFDINKDALVKMKIYNILGQEVRTLVNENKKAGNYSVVFDGTNLASGVYFYRIDAGDFVETKKMVLVK